MRIADRRPGPNHGPNQNEEKIPNDRMVILEQGQLMPITLNHPLQILQEDFRKSKEEILKSQRIVRGLQSDKL